MKIGLIDVDGHNFPNLALMKISAWHKQQGDSVEWYDPMFSGHMDKVYMSKVFSFSPDYPYFIDADEIVPIIIDADHANKDLTRTIELIKKYNSILPNGYNADLGGIEYHKHSESIIPSD